MYMEEAVARYFCVVGPRSSSQDLWWPDVSYNYLAALLAARIGCRVLPIGASMTQFPPGPKWGHWRRVQRSFGTPLAESYINIVCAPPGLPLGRRMSARAMVPATLQDASGMPVLGRVMPEARAAGDATAYDPETALSGLWTVGRRNIAITAPRPKEPTALELEMLRHYDAVVSPTEADAAYLAAHGIAARHYSAKQLAKDARTLPFFMESPDA